MQQDELKYISVHLLDPQADNANEMSAADYERLKDEIAENGCIVPLSVAPMDNGRYLIIGGEHRWRAAREIGLPEVPCLSLMGKKWKEADLRKLVTVRLNIIHGQLNPDKFLGLYNEMAEKYGAAALQHLFGFTDKHAFQKVVSAVKKGMKAALPKEMAKQFEEQAKGAKNIEDLGEIINSAWEKYGASLNSQSYAIFTYGSYEHVYIAMNAESKAAMDKMLMFCKLSGKDVNDIVSSALTTFVQQIDGSKLS